jgi:hypothetical protein
MELRAEAKGTVRRTFYLAALLLAGLGSGCGTGTTAAPTPNSASPTLVTKSPYTLSGTVRDEVGAPVQGADVYVGYDLRRPGFGEGETDPQGRYVVSGLLAGIQPVLVSKPGYLRTHEDVDIQVGTVKDFTLRPGVIVSGKTLEAGVGGLNGVTITVAGVETTSTGPVDGSFQLPSVLPGDFTIRASKAGYDSVDRTVHALADTYVDGVTLKWAYGSCLSAVAPIKFDPVRAAGATEIVSVETKGAHNWTARPNVPWVRVVANASAGGSATLQFQVDPNPIGALDVRTGAIEIRCTELEGQNIWITQMVNCQATAEPDAKTPAVFPALGGSGRLLVRFGVPGCHSHDYSEVDWMFLAGVSSYLSGEVNFAVLPNPSGVERSGVIVVGETRWTVTQNR